MAGGSPLALELTYEGAVRMAVMEVWQEEVLLHWN